MVCVVNPDGTITCSDGDELTASKILSNINKQKPQEKWNGRTMSVDDQLKTIESELRGTNPPMAVFLINGSDVGWVAPA